MGATPLYALPWPELVDPPDGPKSYKALAQATESALTTALETVSSEVVLRGGGTQVVKGNIWTKVNTWVIPEYYTGGPASALTSGASGVYPAKAGRYWAEFACTFPGVMPPGRHGLGIEVTGAALPDDTCNETEWYAEQSVVHQMRTSVTMSLPAGSAGRVTGWIWHQAANTTFDMTTCWLTVRQLRN